MTMVLISFLDFTVIIWRNTFARKDKPDRLIISRYILDPEIDPPKILPNPQSMLFKKRKPSMGDSSN
jgi:hypothetical protein